MLVGCAFCADLNKRHHISSDGKTEVIYLFDDEAVVLHRHPDSQRFDIVSAVPGELPDDPSITRDKIVKVLVRDVAGALIIPSDGGLRILVSGYEPLDGGDTSFEDLVKKSSQQTRMLWLIDARSIIKGKDKEEIERLIPELKNKLTKPLMAPFDFFAEVAALAKVE